MTTVTGQAEAARSIGTVEAGRYADLLLLDKSPLDDIRNLDGIRWVMEDGRLWRPWQLRSGIALTSPTPVPSDGEDDGPALTHPGPR